MTSRNLNSENLLRDDSTKSKNLTVDSPERPFESLDKEKESRIQVSLTLSTVTQDKRHNVLIDHHVK